MRCRANRDTHCYQLKEGKKIVYQGITKNPDSRFEDHVRSGKKFTHMLCGPKRSRSRALKEERASIERYKRSHGGRRPKYNRI